MADLSEAQQIAQPLVRKAPASAFLRVMQYSAVRLITLFATVIVAIYLTVMIANMGGFVDQIMRNEMRERITVQVVNNPANKNLSLEARNQLVLQKIALE